MGEAERILIIKLGALGDFIQALGPMAAIRRHHGKARITLLTTKPYADLAKASGLVDEVWVDTRPKVLQIGEVLALRKRLRGGHFDRVYDLQTSQRSNFYFKLMRPGFFFGSAPDWSGIAPGCSHPHTNPGRDAMHTVERQSEQLALAGIGDVALTDLSAMARDVGHLDANFGVKAPYALLVPGGAVHRPAKRWPAESYAAIAQRLLEGGITPVLLGGDDERGLLSLIARDCPGAVNLGSRTDFIDIATLARGALVALGNDTGPMHIIAASGCPSVVLFSAESDPRLCAPKAKRVRVLSRDDLGRLDVAEAWTALAQMGGPALTDP